MGGVCVKHRMRAADLEVVRGRGEPVRGGTKNNSFPQVHYQPQREDRLVEGTGLKNHKRNTAAE